MFTIRPHLARSIPRSAARLHRNAPLRLVAIVCSYTSIGYLRSRPSRDIPALFTSPVTGPSSSPTRRKASVTEPSSVTSIATARPDTPILSRAPSVSFASASLER